jgi:LPXTG-motif cell wall-anchored protein
MSRLIVLFLTATLMTACAATPDTRDTPDVSAAPPEGATEIRELPKTASQLPAMGLTGAASLLAAWGIRILRRRVF